VIASISGTFFLGFLIGLTGALAPGPTLIATINTSLKGGWSVGPKVTLGHILVEILMVFFVILGISVLIGPYSFLIAGIGGVSLIVFGALTILECRNARLDFDNEGRTISNPYMAGVVTSVSNPYFWIWWLTVGSALLLSAYEGGLILAGSFIIGHWVADLAWLTLVSASVHQGRVLLNQHTYRWILGACGVFLVVFGGYYLSSALPLNVLHDT
jgi:threonine/homoserine/homoserine lactone efflux protein